MKNFRYDGAVIPWYNGTGVAVSSGDPVNIGGRMGVAVVDIAAAASGAVRTEGVFEVDAIAGAAFAIGDDLFWDATQAKATIFQLGNTYLGKAAASSATATTAKAQAGTRVLVKLEPVPGTLSRVTKIHDTFIAPALESAGDSWAISDTSAAGAPTCAIKSVRNGAAEITLAATDEAEHVIIYHADKLGVDIDDDLVMEMDVEVNTMPSTNQSMYLGLASATNATPASIAEHLLFVLDASANLIAWTDDGTTDISDADTGVNLVADTRYKLQIDARDQTDVRIFVDGVDKTAAALAAATGTPAAFDVSAMVTGLLQPYFRVTKSAGTGVPSLYVHEVLVTGSA